MASLIARVTTTSSRAPLEQLLTTPLGLDVWEVTPEHFVLQADEAQASRLEAMGYEVEQLRPQGGLLRLPPRARVDLRRGALPFGRSPVGQLVVRAHTGLAAAGGGVGGPDGEPRRTRAHSDDGPALAQEPAHKPGRQQRRRRQPHLRLHVGHAGLNTSSHVPSDQTYVGPRAFSEPEVRAVRNLVARQLFGGVLSYHSYSQLILFPWGFTAKPLVDEVDLREMRGLAEDMERLIRGVHGQTYTAQQSSRLYPTAGDTTDWTYGEYDVPSLTIELRPASAMAGGVILPAEQIEPCWEENRPAALAFIRHILDPADG